MGFGHVMHPLGAQHSQSPVTAEVRAVMVQTTPL